MKLVGFAHARVAMDALFAAATPVHVAAAAATLLVPYAAFASVQPEPKRRAWFLTLVTACVVGPGSLPTVFAHVFPAFDEAAQFSDEPRAAFLCTFFVAFLVADCAVGALHYPSQFHVFEGWIHHAVYAAFFAWLTRAGYTVAGASTLALELPTAILAAGHCFPAARADLLYGCAFFAVRVAFHFYLLVKWVAMRDPPIALWPCTAATLLLHAFWFFKWCRSYAKQRAKEKGV